MKGIVVVNFPERCDECDLLSEFVYCQGIGGESVIEYTISKQKPDWCPVKPFPVKTSSGIEVCIGNHHSVSYAEGWNACVDSLER